MASLAARRAAVPSSSRILYTHIQNNGYLVLSNFTMATATRSPLTLTAPFDPDPASRKAVSEEYAREICQGFQESIDSHPGSVVTRIELGGGAYTSSAAAIVAEFLTQVVADHAVTELDISDTISSLPEKEGLEVLTTLSDAFQGCELKYLRNSDNALGSKGIKACHSIIEGQKKCLQHLIMYNDGLAKESLLELEEMFTTPNDDGSCTCDNFLTFHFDNNMTGVEGAITMGRIIGKMKKIEDLRYSSCRSLRTGSAALANGLNDMGDNIVSVKKLHLLGNFFKNDDTEVDETFLSALRRATSLTHLILRDCSLGLSGTRDVCLALYGNATDIVELDLSENEAERGDCSKAMAKLIGSLKSTLKILNVEDNELTSEGVKHIIKALSGSNSVVEDVKFGTTMCGHIGANALCNATLPNLETIELDGNFFSAENVERLEEVFAEKLAEMEMNEDDEDVDEDEEVKDDDDDDFDEQADSDEDIKEFTQVFASSLNF